MSNQRPRIVLVGAGGYGRLYVETMAQRDYGADLAAICDIDPHLADRIPIIREQSIPIYPSLEAFLRTIPPTLQYSSRRCISTPIWCCSVWRMG